jgi:phosphomannomutase/phosphoglucomutase
MSETKKTADVLGKFSLLGNSISLVVAIIIFVYLALIALPAQNQQRISIVSQDLLVQQAGAVNAVIVAWQNRLQGLAKDPALMAILEQNDQTGLAIRQQQLDYSFADADVRLVTLGKLGIASVDRTVITSNIEMDLLRQTSDGKMPAPEAYLAGKNWMIVLVIPVPSVDGTFTSGAVLVRLPVQHIVDVMADLSSRGKLEFVQSYNNQRQVIAMLGNADNAAGVYSQPLSIKAWQLEFTPGPAFVSAYSEAATSIWLMMAALIVAILGGSILTARLLNKVISSDIANLSSPTPPAFQLAGFAEAHVRLCKLMRSFNDSVEGAVPSASPAASLQNSVQSSASQPAVEVVEESFSLSETIFRAYDIRGTAEDELNDAVVNKIGQAVGSESLARGETTVIVAMDGRLSSPRIKQALASGLQASGCNVIDIGMVPTPVLYFATHQLGATSGVMVTGSHNPPQYNGLKMVVAGKTLSGAEIQSLKKRILQNDLKVGKGSYRTATVEDQYVDYIVNDVAIAQPLKIVIDCGNGVPGMLAPRLFSELGCEVIPLYCEVDGNFPNHHPDPSEAKNLRDLIAKVQEVGADIGIAFDGDGDRVGAVTATGQVVPADRLLMLFAQDVVSRNPGADILFDVKCTRFLSSLISSYGGRPIMWKTGHSFMKEKMAETGALLGGEYSGHIFFKERWFGFDDGLYSAARLIEILSTTDPDLDAQLSQFPESVNTPEIKMATTEEAKFDIIERLSAQGNFGDGKVSTLDGVRVDFPDGWGLIRASNTTPMLILRFEADNQNALSRIIALFKQNLRSVDSSLDFDV